MAEAYYNDEITIDEVKQYWAVGDTRRVDLAAMEATGVGESHRAQTVQFVIGDFEHDDLTEPINGHTKALITLLQKDCLMDKTSELNNNNGSNDTEKGYMNSLETNVGGWKSCARRTWCNETYYNAIPDSLKNSVKEVNKDTSIGGRNTTIEKSVDKIFISSETEIFGSLTYSAYGEGTQYQYYKGSMENRYKIPRWSSSYVTQVYWTRSPNKNTNDSFCCVGGSGTAGQPKANLDRGISIGLCI